jgi:type IV secretion system protein VirB10
VTDRPPLNDRSVSPVAKRQWISPKAKKIAIGAGALGAVGLTVLGVNAAINDPGIQHNHGESGPTMIQQTTPPPMMPVSMPVQTMTPPAPPPLPPPLPAALQPPPTVVAPKVDYVVMPASGAGETYFKVAAPTPKKEDPTPGAPGQQAAQAAAATTQVAFKPSTLAGSKAGPAIRLTYVMMPQAIPCALDGAMDSTIAGSIFCHTTQDVLSPDHIMLMPAGTQITGSYKSDVKTGQSRMFSFAGNAITQEGIPVPLDSQMADSMGRTGIPGEVDNHYLQRFGASIALTAAQMASSILQASVSKGGNSYLSFSSGGGGGVGDLSTEILRRQADIPPTIYVAPGTVVSVVVDHPIDFSDAIKVGTR